MINWPSQSQKDEAKKLYEQYLKLKDQGQQKEALNCIERVIQLDPDNEVYWFNQGWVLRWFSRDTDAIESLNTSISLKPNLDAYSLKAISLSRLNRKQESIECLEQALIQFPNTPYIISHLNSYKPYNKKE